MRGCVIVLPPLTSHSASELPEGTEGISKQEEGAVDFL